MLEVGHHSVWPDQFYFHHLVFDFKAESESAYREYHIYREYRGYSRYRGYTWYRGYSRYRGYKDTQVTEDTEDTDNTEIQQFFGNSFLFLDGFLPQSTLYNIICHDITITLIILFNTTLSLRTGQSLNDPMN